VFAAGATACGSSSSGHPHAPPGDIPKSVSIPGGPMQSGLATSSVRQTDQVAPFAISKTPTTVGQYGQCVKAGVCTTPALKRGACARPGGKFGATYSQDKSTDDEPVTCVTGDQAITYCDWVGGRLSTVSEWLLAARGPEVREYPWGNALPSCKQRSNLNLDSSYDCCGTDCKNPEASRVATHPAGDSPFGVSDILTTSAELVGASASGMTLACPPSAHVCLVTGITPGSIDGLLPERMVAASGRTNGAIASFRCVWEGVGQ
jgi:formylglycine-generating enzyme required for sulfatase activity